MRSSCNSLGRPWRLPRRPSASKSYKRPANSSPCSSRCLADKGMGSLLERVVGTGNPSTEWVGHDAKRIAPVWPRTSCGSLQWPEAASYSAAVVAVANGRTGCGEAEVARRERTSDSGVDAALRLAGHPGREALLSLQL